MERKAYPSDLRDSEWQVLEEYMKFQFDSFPTWNMEQYQQVLLEMLNSKS